MSVYRSTLFGDSQPQRGILWSPDQSCQPSSKQAVASHCSICRLSPNPSVFSSGLTPSIKCPRGSQGQGLWLTLRSPARVSQKVIWMHKVGKGIQNPEVSLHRLLLASPSSPSSGVPGYPNFCDENLLALCWLPPLQSQAVPFAAPFHLSRCYWHSASAVISHCFVLNHVYHFIPLLSY